MTVKETLAKLSTHLSSPLHEYSKIDVAVTLSNNISLLSKLEPFRLPEITKLICSNPSLMEHFGMQYNYLLPYYEDNSVETMLTRMADTEKDSYYFINFVFPLADLSILDGFICAFNDLDKQIKLYQKTLEEKKEKQDRILEKITGKENEIKAIDAELMQNTPDSEDSRGKELVKKRKSLKGILTRYQKDLEKIQQGIQDITSKCEVSCEQYRRLIEAYKVAKTIKKDYQAKLSNARSKAYESCDEKNTIQKILLQFLSTNEIPAELSDGLKQYDFACQFLSLISNSYPTEAVSIIARLYENSLIDICDDPFCSFLSQNAEAVALYFLKNYISEGATEFNTEETDFDSWIDFIVDKAFFETDNCMDYTALDALWDKLPSVSCWRSIINVIVDHDEDAFLNCLAKLLLRVTGSSRKHLITLAQELIQEEVIESCSSLVVSLIDNHVPGDDCSALVELFLQKLEGECRKLRETNERLKFNAGRVSVKAYGSLSKPIESLEILASNIASGHNDISPELVSSKLKKHLVVLREGLEVLDIYPLEDTDDWISSKAIPFNPENHSISLSTPPQTVYLRTLGFSYRNADGNDKIAPAIVGLLQELEKPKSAESRTGKPKHSYQGKPNIPRRSKPKHKYRKKDGAKE